MNIAFCGKLKNLCNMDQSKGSKSGIFYSLKQRFWPNGVTNKSCFKGRSSKLKLRSDSSHYNFSVPLSDSCTGTPNNSTRTTELKNVFSVSEPAIATCLVESNEIVNSSPKAMCSLAQECNTLEQSDGITHRPTNDNVLNNATVLCRTTDLNSVDRPLSLSDNDFLNFNNKNVNVITSSINQSENENLKSGLMCELVKLSKYGWYWGSMTKEEAEEKLTDQPDGAFLLRDSSADHFILSLSFRSSGKTLHTRIEYNLGRGQFSFYQQSDECFATIAELIDHSMSYSQSAVYCYSRSRSPGIPAFPVRLTKPVSRFAHVRSLQHLCRFVIRESIRLDNIPKLPLPNSIKGYLEEGHY